MTTKAPHERPTISNPLDWVIWQSMRNPLLVVLALALLIGWGLSVAPFDWAQGVIPRDPVPVDAIPDIGENQQIVFTEWAGRSPQDVEDQVSYPLTVALLGVPGVKTIRSQSVFGFSSVNVIFEEDIDFYWSRSRILERLSALPSGTLPDGVRPSLGPDATALGQVFWYTLEGRDPQGNPAGGWSPHELRSIQDWNVRYALASADGVSEVASIGGFVQEYQVDVDPDAMRAADITLDEVFAAVKDSNLDVGARTIEVNNVEYVIRGLGYLKNLDDLRNSVVKTRDNVPIYIRDVGTVSRGPALRRGVLDKAGAEATGGVVVVRYGANPLEVIQNVKQKIGEITPGMPTKVVIDHHKANNEEVSTFAESQGFEAYEGVELNQDAWLKWLRENPSEEWPEWVTTSTVTVIPFYDRTGLIKETLGTLESAIILQLIATAIIVLIMVRHIRSTIVIGLTLPLSVLLAFIMMKLFDVTANVVALSGIAIAIGTVVDMGVILSENVLRRLNDADERANRTFVIYNATREVGGAVLTAIATTVVSFLPVLTMTGAEGKLFVPLALTKTFTLIASVLIALLVLPSVLRLVYLRVPLRIFKLPPALFRRAPLVCCVLFAILGVLELARLWLPLGPGNSLFANTLFVGIAAGGLLFAFQAFQWVYPSLLRFFLNHKLVYLSIPLVIGITGAMVWAGANWVLSPMPEAISKSNMAQRLDRMFPGLGKEFMPPLDEGAYLYMPSLMPHASLGQAKEVLAFQDRAFAAIPEVESVIGKIGRVESALDPAPISMVETIINYKSEFITDEDGRLMRFAFDYAADEFEYDELGQLIPSDNGLPFRQWRDHIRNSEDIWEEILASGEMPGVTSAPKLQPIMTRVIMLQSGMRAAMGVKVSGPDLATIERVGIEIESKLREVPGVAGETVFAERIVGKPYLEIDIDRERAARYGISVRDVQDVIEVAIGGRTITTTVEGRERYPVRVRYQRELRDDIESLERILVAGSDGEQIPMIQLADIRYVRGPQSIRSEDTFLNGYVTFDKKEGYAEVDVVEACQAYLSEQLASGEWSLPPGVSFAFAGNYENQLRAQRTLSFVIPIAIGIIFVILYLQFRSFVTSGIVILTIAVAWAGGFILLWLYGQPWFLDMGFAGTSLRDVFQVDPVLLSVAIWVGFLALFGIASDDGVVMASYLDSSNADKRPESIGEIHEAVIAGALHRIRPCLTTSATTILALLPILTSTGRGSDIMIPMAIPTFGGMMIALITLFMVPVLYCAKEELAFHLHLRKGHSDETH